MESAESGMELARSAVWNHHGVLHGINPKGNEEYSLTADSMRGRAAMLCSAQSALMPYQSFGLDKKAALIGGFFRDIIGFPTFAFGEIGGARLAVRSQAATRSAARSRTPRYAPWAQALG